MKKLKTSARVSGPLRFGIIAGEASGDTLGAGLITALKHSHPDIIIEGVAGPQMIAAGCKMLAPMEKLSVMGVSEVIGKIPSLLALRRKLIKHWLANPPDVFIGIDAPDFNLTIEQHLKNANILTVHYCSPTVWAWRPNRIVRIGKAINLMLTLFPFEEEIYKKNNIPVKYVGHPLADIIPLHPDMMQARTALNIPHHAHVLALMPGSRAAELKYLTRLFLQAAQWCYEKYPELLCIAPMINAERRKQFTTIARQVAPHLPLRIVDGQSHPVIAAADVVLSASGTATLEAALFKRPLVVAYRLAPLNYWIAKKLVKVRYIALPNILLGKEVAPEFIQEAAVPEAIGAAVLQRLEDPMLRRQLEREYLQIHHQLRCDASRQAAAAILNLL